MKLAVFGFGNVGQVLARQALISGASVTAIADSSCVLVSKSKEFSLNSLENIIEKKNLGQKLKTIDEPDLECITPDDYINKIAINNSILADCSAFDDANVYLLPALRKGIPVALANKTPLTGSLDQFNEFISNRQKIRFETTVGAGLPVIHTLRRLLDAGDEVNSIQGLLSGTLGYIFSELSTSNLSFSEIVKNAHQNGYTEPDPRDDLSGKDVARKVLILSRMLGYQLNLEDITVESLYPSDMTNLTIDEFILALPKLDEDFETRKNDASGKGGCLRYVADIQCDEDGKANVSVGVKLVPKTDELGTLRGTDNCIVFDTKAYSNNKLVIKGPGAGLDVTAQGVLADCYDLFGKAQYC